jgi:hypothetical protein
MEKDRKENQHTELIHDCLHAAIPDVFGYQIYIMMVDLFVGGWY